MKMMNWQNWEVKWDFKNDLLNKMLFLTTDISKPLENTRCSTCPKGKKAILRKKSWGNDDLSISLEGIQDELNNFLVGYPSVDYSKLRDSLIQCFVSKKSLEEAEKEVTSILKIANDFVLYQIDRKARAKVNCIAGKPPEPLECVAVTAYTMESNLYRYLNQDLRDSGRTLKTLENWKPFLKLFLGALKCMNPVTSGTVYRGLNCVVDDYKKKLSPDRECIYWYTVTSTSDNLKTATEFATKGKKTWNGIRNFFDTCIFHCLVIQNSIGKRKNLSTWKLFQSYETYRKR